MSVTKSAVLFTLFCCLFISSDSKVIEIKNSLEGPIWIGGQANRGFPLPNGGGWHLEREQRISITVPDRWTGRFWPRTWCNITGDNSCETGGCGPNFECRGLRAQSPASMVEFKFRKAEDDQYSISLVHGFNTMVTVIPLDPEPDQKGDGRCETISCKHGFYGDSCPTELQRRNYMYVIGCHSACDVLKTDQHCCKGAYQKAHLCNPTYWPDNYPKVFKDKCPKVKTYLYDNDDVWHSCKARGYLIILNQ